MSSSCPEPNAADSIDLSGVRILLVEDSWHVAVGLKSWLHSVGAEVAGPVATIADAERVISQQVPDAAIVDFNLRGGELAHGLIDSMNARRIHVIVLSGYSSVPVAPGKVASILQKPVVETELIAALRPVAQAKEAK